MNPYSLGSTLGITLGHVGYYHRFIENFTKIVASMFKFLTKDVEFQWTKSCQNDFEILKDKISVAPILRGPDWSLPFHISIDASDTTIGGVLGQKEGQSPYAIYFLTLQQNPMISVSFIFLFSVHHHF